MKLKRLKILIIPLLIIALFGFGMNSFASLHSKWSGGDLIFYDGATDIFTIKDSTDGLVVHDDINLTFGDGSDATIEWDADGTSKLILTCSSGFTLAGDLGFTGDILMATTSKIQFHDAGLYINASGNGALVISSDGTLTVGATTSYTLTSPAVKFIATTSVIHEHDAASYLTQTIDNAGVVLVSVTGDTTGTYEIATDDGSITLDSASTILLESTTGITATGDISASNAAGPQFVDEAATTTNPTLCPDKAEDDTGLGWASDTIHIVLGGVDEYSFSTSTFDMNSNTITEAGTITATNAAGPTVINLAATATVPTLCPNRNETDTGIGWQSDVIHIVLGGVDEYNFSGTSFITSASDGASLGTVTYMWSDLFLASEAVINFNNGNMTITHSAGDLAVAGGTFTTAGVVVGGTYDHGIRFTEDPTAGDVTNSFINIGDYTTAIAVAPTTANMFGEMHNVTLTDVNVAYWYQAHYTKITTSGTTTSTSIAGHALRINVATNLEAVYGIQCHTNITAGADVTQEIVSISTMVDMGTGDTTTDRVVALQAMITGSGTAGTVTGLLHVAYLANRGTVIDTDAIVFIHNQSAATSDVAVEFDLDGTVTNVWEFNGTVCNAFTTADIGGSTEFGARDEYVLIPVIVEGVTPPLYIIAAETWVEITP